MKLALVLSLVVAVACKGSAPAGVELVDAPAATADVAAAVRDAMHAAADRHRRLVVYVGATWCEPCEQFHAAAVAHQLDAEFPDLTLIVFDLDRSGPALERSGYQSELIPLFVVPEPDGRGGTHRVSGGVKVGDNVKLLTAKLHSLLD
jgi:thiol-disulfide isomerase/thioredoxin